METQLNRLHTVAFTHRNLAVSEIGNLHIDPNDQKERLSAFKTAMGLEELMFLSTCNRVEFLLVTDDIVDHSFLHRFFDALYPGSRTPLSNS